MGFLFVSCSFPMKCCAQSFSRCTVSKTGQTYLCAGDHTSSLHSGDRLRHQLAGKIGVNRKSCRHPRQHMKSLGSKRGKPSQFRPLSTTRPAGPTTGPSRTFTPLVRNSPPMPDPRWRASTLFQLAPTWIPLGHELTKSVCRRPFPASPRHMPGKPRRGMPGRKPGQLVLELSPEVTLTYSPC